jgi:hypothetical protein
LVTEQDGKDRFEEMSTWREIVPVSIAPAPTFTPLPTLTPMPSATPLPTATAKPQLKTGLSQSAQSGTSLAQLPLIMGGALAVVIVLGVIIGRIVWVTRR